MHKSEHVLKHRKYRLTNKRNKKVKNRTYPLHFLGVKCYNLNKHPINLNIYSNIQWGKAAARIWNLREKQQPAAGKRAYRGARNRPQEKLCKLLEEEYQL